MNTSRRKCYSNFISNMSGDPRKLFARRRSETFGALQLLRELSKRTFLRQLFNDLFLTRGYAKRRNGFLLGLRYANVSLAHSGVESS